MQGARQNKGSGVIDQPGILDSRPLPDEEFHKLWHAIIVEPETKDRLLAQAVLNFTLRPKLSRARIPLHGVILLVGPPGTGKTSLARGLAAVTAEALDGKGMHYLEVDPHALTSAALGHSQKAVTELLGSTIAGRAETGPLIVLLDEVETLAPARSKLSLEANPVDVHRAADAVLVQLDHLAAEYPELLFVATSNFTQAIDEAFWSRADLVVQLQLPGTDACRRILVDTIGALAEAYPDLAGLAGDPDLGQVADICVSLDGRSIRKLVVSACALDKHIALHPDRLTIGHLLRAAEHARRASLRCDGGTE